MPGSDSCRCQRRAAPFAAVVGQVLVMKPQKPRCCSSPVLEVRVYLPVMGKWHHIHRVAQRGWPLRIAATTQNLVARGTELAEHRCHQPAQ